MKNVIQFFCVVGLALTGCGDSGGKKGGSDKGNTGIEGFIIPTNLTALNEQQKTQLKDVTAAKKGLRGALPQGQNSGVGNPRNRWGGARLVKDFFVSQKAVAPGSGYVEGGSSSYSPLAGKIDSFNCDISFPENENPLSRQTEIEAGQSIDVDIEFSISGQNCPVIAEIDTKVVMTAVEQSSDQGKIDMDVDTESMIEIVDRALLQDEKIDVIKTNSRVNMEWDATVRKGFIDSKTSMLSESEIVSKKYGKVETTFEGTVVGKLTGNSEAMTGNMVMDASVKYVFPTFTAQGSFREIYSAQSEKVDSIYQINGEKVSAQEFYEFFDGSLEGATTGSPQGSVGQFGAN